jgi:hypothetical protein
MIAKGGAMAATEYLLIEHAVLEPLENYEPTQKVWLSTIGHFERFVGGKTKSC